MTKIKGREVNADMATPIKFKRKRKPASDTEKVKKRKKKTIEDYALTVRQEAFCREYPYDWNITQAVIRAGYSPNGADVIGSNLLRDIRVKKRIDKIKKERAERIDIRADKVVLELAKIAFVGIDDKTSDNKFYRAKDKLKALELLMKHLGIDQSALINPKDNDDGFETALENAVKEIQK